MGRKPEWARPEFYDDLVAAAKPRAFDYRDIEENSVAEETFLHQRHHRPRQGRDADAPQPLLSTLSIRVWRYMIRMPPSMPLLTVALAFFHVNSWGSPHILTLVGGRHVMIRKFDSPIWFSDWWNASESRAFQMRCRQWSSRFSITPDFGKYDLNSVKGINNGRGALQHNSNTGR